MEDNVKEQEGRITDIAESTGEELKEKDVVDNSGRVTEIVDGAPPRPLQVDTNKVEPPLNKHPKYKDLISPPSDPKKLIGQSVSKIEKGVNSYFDAGDTESLEIFLKNFMHFPRDLVRKAEKYLSQLRIRDGSAGHTVGELKGMNKGQLMAIGNKIGLFFDASKTEENMIQAILEMQSLNIKRRAV